MFMNSPPFIAWDVHYPVFSGTIYEQKHMFLPLYNHTKLCHLELDFKCRFFHFGTWGISSNISQFHLGIFGHIMHYQLRMTKKVLDYNNNYHLQWNIYCLSYKFVNKVFPYDKNRKNWSQGYFFYLCLPLTVYL